MSFLSYCWDILVPITVSGWWFQTFFIFIPTWGEDFQFDEHIYFSDGWETTTNYMYGFNMFELSFHISKVTDLSTKKTCSDIFWKLSLPQILRQSETRTFWRFLRAKGQVTYNPVKMMTL